MKYKNNMKYHKILHNIFICFKVGLYIFNQLPATDKICNIFLIILNGYSNEFVSLLLILDFNNYQTVSLRFVHFGLVTL